MIEKLRTLSKKCLRAGAYLAVVGVAVSAVGARSAQAKANKAAFAMGESLADVDVAPGGGTVLSVNGRKLNIASSHVDAPVHDVLDRVQRACETYADGLADDLGELDTMFKKSPTPRGYAGIGLLRDERDDRGVVACFAAGTRTAEPSSFELARRLATFAESRDLADIGGVRYVAVHEEEGGSRVVATWTDERLPLEEMFPDEGDAPGEDPSAAPRPRAGRRLFSARVAGATYGAFAYVVPGDAGAALASYERDVLAKGFAALPLPDRAAADGSRVYSAGLVDLLVTATPEDDGTTLSVVESLNATARSRGDTHR